MLGMERKLKARYWKGSIEPLEKLDFEEGVELMVTVEEISPKVGEAFEKSAGAWRGKVEAERLIDDIYNSRLVKPRPEARL